jgi:hypothetical protein
MLSVSETVEVGLGVEEPVRGAEFVTEYDFVCDLLKDSELKCDRLVLAV